MGSTNVKENDRDLQLRSPSQDLEASFKLEISSKVVKGGKFSDSTKT